jgi:hypothetical protein
MKVKGDYPDRVHSDQMVLRVVRPREAGLPERYQRQLKGGHQAQVHSVQMALVVRYRILLKNKCVRSTPCHVVYF